jgi:hypothetical protein
MARARCFVGMLVLWLGACGGDDDGGGGGVCDDVKALLDQVNRTTHCPEGGAPLAAQCKSGIQRKPDCVQTVQALLDCARAQPIEDWACQIFDYPGLKTGACTEQDDAIATCFGG